MADKRKRKAKKTQNKNVALKWIFICWEASTYKIPKISSNGLVLKIVFFYQIRHKKLKLKKVKTLFGKKHLEIQSFKISSNGLDFRRIFIFYKKIPKIIKRPEIFFIFLKKIPKRQKHQRRKLGSLWILI